MRDVLSPSYADDIVTFSQTALPHRLFFAGRERAPTDRPAYFAHQRRLMAGLDAIRTVGGRCAPFASRAETWTLPEGDDVVFVPTPPGRAADRSIIGVTVRVASRASLGELLRKNGIAYDRPEHCGNTLWVRPDTAHNLWLEFRA